MKNVKYSIGIFISLALMFSSCQDDDFTVGEIIAPTNVTLLDPEIVGQDINVPGLEYGDGSGIVNFKATSDDAITYRYDFGDNTDVVSAPSGEVTHTFTVTDVNTYTVTVMASGTGGITSTDSRIVEVYSSFEDQEAKDFLTGGAGTSKTWYWAADKPGNIGLGPNDVMSGGEHTYDQWFVSTAWHSDKLCMYDAEFVFSQAVDGTFTFEQTEGIAYIPGDYAGSIGVAAEACHGVDVVPSLDGIKNVSMAPSTSIATVDGEYRGTTLNFTDGGFMCWYVGISSLEIIEITENSLYVRMTDASNPGLAWYCKYQTSVPVPIG